MMFGVTTAPVEIRRSWLDGVRQFVCGLTGHDSLPQFERDRMYLKCASCGHETPGWRTGVDTTTRSVR